jgi:protein involved in sex pheromone biosynthesis
MKNAITYLAVCAIGLAAAGCSTPSVNQELVVDKQVQPLSRNEVIYAVRECETNGLRAVVLYAKRKINGYTTEIVAEVTCAPKGY